MSHPTTRNGLGSPARLPSNSEPSPSHAAARCGTGCRAVSALEEWADHKQGWLNHGALHRRKGVSEGFTGFLFGQKPSFTHSLVPCASSVCQAAGTGDTGAKHPLREAHVRGHRKHIVSGTAPWLRGLLLPYKIIQIFLHDCVGIEMNINQAASYFFIFSFQKILKYFCELLKVPWFPSMVSAVLDGQAG